MHRYRINRNKRSKYTLLLFLITGFLPFELSAADVLKGDADAAAGQTFSFPVQANATAPDGNSFYTGAHPTLGTPKDFAIAAVGRDTPNFFPLAPEQVVLNGEQHQVNPLYNAHIQYLALLSAVEGMGPNRSRINHPVAVLATDLTSVYTVDTFYTNLKLVHSVVGVKDAGGVNATTGIVGLGAIFNVFVAAAVKSSSGGNFGAIGSGIAILKLTDKKVEGDSQFAKRTFFQVDALATSGPASAVRRALPLDVSSAALKITSNLASMQNIANFFNDEALQVLYVGLQVQGGAGASDGALAVARILYSPDGSTFVLYPMAPATVFTDSNEIIGGVGANTQVSITALKTMYTSTNFNYLIVQGGNGGPSANPRSVYALPLVNNVNNPSTHGAIANKLEDPHAILGSFSEPATTPAQMTTTADVAARVGGGALPIGDITDLYVKGDSVYVTVATADAGQQPGIFYSQAIFDSTGKIAVWTTWKRVTGALIPTYATNINSFGNSIIMTGATSDTIQTVQRTVWGMDEGDNLLGGPSASPQTGLTSAIAAQFPKTIGGLQGLYEFPPSTGGLNNSSLLVATGLSKVMLAQTGNSASGSFAPTIGNYTNFQEEFTNGTITKDLPAPGTTPNIVTITEGALNGIGPVTDAHVMSTGGFGWLFVGGAHGLAVLVDTNGNGWNTATGLGAYFAGLTNGMRFVTVGAYKFVRKLISQNGLLYVLTDTTLDRIDVAASSFLTNTLATTRLATIPTIPQLTIGDSFIDFIASNKLGLLATNTGFYRTGNGVNVGTTTAADANWTKVPLAESIGPATQLLAVSVTGRPEDVATQGGGNLIVLNAYVGKNRAQVSRYAIADISSSEVSDTTVQPLANFYIVGIQAPFVTFASFRDVIGTDGAAFLSAQDRDLGRDPFVQIAFDLRRGVRFGNNNSARVPLSLGSASRILTLFRSAVLGSWMIGSDIGLLVNE